MRTALLLTYIFVLFSRLQEFPIGDYFFYRMRVFSIVFILALLAALWSGRLRYSLSSPLGLLLAAFTVWMLPATAFSVWKANSLEILYDVWLPSVAPFVLVASLAVSLRECRGTMYAITLATLVCVGGNTMLGLTEVGRLTDAAGTLNANDLANHLLIGIPFCILMIADPRPFPKIIGIGSVALVLLGVMKTGSRGGLIILTVLTLLFLWKCSWVNKLKVSLVLLALAAYSVRSLPEIVRYRYLTLFPGATKDELIAAQLEGAIGSQESRWASFKESLALTLRHPVFGVGPGGFMTASGKAAERLSEAPSWLETHNTYTQISSEMGLPGLLFYGAAYVLCLRRTASVYRLARRRADLTPLSDMAFALLLSLVALGVAGLFSNMGYLFRLPLLAGLTLAFSTQAEAEIQAAGTEGRHTAAGLFAPPATARI